MRLGKISMAVMVALSMAGTPVLAQTASSASKLSVSAAASKSVRSGAAVEGNEARGSSIILAVGAIGLVVLGAVVLAGGKSKPKSP
jgi:hypothetical protein